MTIQSKANSATSEHAQSPLWQRLAPLLDVIGAVLIFVSWIFSNTMWQRAQEQANTHQAIIERVRQFRLYDDFAHQVADIQSDLARTRNLVEYGTQARNSSDGKSDPPTWTGMTATLVRELNEFVQDLALYAEQLSASGVVTQTIETAQSGARELTNDFAAARDDYDRLVEQLSESTSLAADDLAAEEELRKRVDRLWHDHDTAKRNMLHAGDELLRTAATESESASQLAKQCKQLSYALYVLGTLIILFGRTKSVLGAKKTHRN